MPSNDRPPPSEAPILPNHFVDEETPLLHDDPATPSLTGPAASAEQTVLVDELSTTRLAIVLGSVFVGVFLGAFDGTVIATLSAPISTSFSSLSLLSWLASAYLIANAACQPLAGRLTDIFSRRTGLVVSNSLFAAGNLICGLAASEWSMIAGRIVAGMGGGGLMVIGTFVASDLVPLRKRGLIQGIANICYGSGASLGGLFGGWVNDTWGWRYAFLSQVPMIAISGTLVFFTVRIPPKKSDRSKLSRVDFSGAFMLVVTLVLLLLGLTSGGNIVSWTHPLVLVSIPFSLVALGAFIRIETKSAKEPVLPINLLLDRTVAAACLTNWFSTMMIYMSVFYIPIFFQVKGFSTTAAGLRLLPLSIGGSIGSLSAGLIMNYTGKYKALGLSSTGTFILGLALLNTVTLDTPEGPALLYFFFIGSGYSSMLTVTLLAAISSVSHDHQAVITSATYAFRSTGSIIGVTIGSAVYQNLLLSNLHQRFDDFEGADDEIRRIRDSLEELRRLPDGWEEGVYESYGIALRGVFATGLGLAVLGLVAATFMREHKLHRTISRRDE